MDKPLSTYFCLVHTKIESKFRVFTKTGSTTRTNFGETRMQFHQDSGHNSNKNCNSCNSEIDLGEKQVFC